MSGQILDSSIVTIIRIVNMTRQVSTIFPAKISLPHDIQRLPNKLHQIKID